MEGKDEILIHQTWQPLFSDILEILRCFDSAPRTPNIAAGLSLVFDVTQERESQKRLGNWLVGYIEPFLLNAIRDQQDLQEKTLAIATYLFIASRVDLDQKLPEEYLIDYIEYASNQSWFEDYFLAFYCHYLKDQLAACGKIEEFFKQNYERVLGRKHIPAVSQSLIVLNGVITETESKRGCELLESLLDNNSIFTHIAWGTWGLSAYGKGLEKLIAVAENKLNDAFWFIRRNSGLSGVLVIGSFGGGRAEVFDYLSKVTKNQGEKRIKITAEDSSFSIDMNSIPSPISGNDLLSLFDLCLALIAISNSRHDKVAYITGLEDASLKKASERIKRLSQRGGIDLSRAEKNVINSLIVFALLLIFCWVVFIQIGGTLNPDFSSVSLHNWSIEEILLSLAFLDYLLGAIQAIRTDRNAVKGLLSLPILRHFQAYRSKRRDTQK